MGKLNIAHHKSYHPYKADNIERVRRDEERAAAMEAGDRAKVMQADSEARIALLRKKSKRGKTKEEDEAEKALERQLKGKGRNEEGNGDDEMQLQPEIRATIVRPTDTTLDHILTDKGHFNFWADLEKGNPAQASRPNKNAEYEAEKKAEQEKWDSQITMYLKAPPKTWYDSSDGLNHKERKMTEDQKLEHAYKDNEHKRGEDPLAMMHAYLKRKAEVKAAQERQKADPWVDTPRTLAAEKTPVQPFLLSSKRNGKDRYRHRSTSPLENVSAGPARPPVPIESISIHKAAFDREASERDRAKALLAAKRKEIGPVISTPQSEFGYQTGMYNRTETRNAKGYSNVRWDSDMDDRRRASNPRDRYRL